MQLRRWGAGDERIRLWDGDDVIRRVPFHGRVFDCQGTATAGIDTAAIDERGVAGDDAAGDGECAFVVDTAALPRRVTEQRAVVDGQRAQVGDAAALPRCVTEQLAVVDDKRARVLDGAAAVVAEGAASVVVGEYAVLDGDRAQVEDGTATLAAVVDERAVVDGEGALVLDGAAPLVMVVKERAVVHGGVASVEDPSRVVVAEEHAVPDRERARVDDAAGYCQKVNLGEYALVDLERSAAVDDGGEPVVLDDERALVGDPRMSMAQVFQDDGSVRRHEDGQRSDGGF